MNNVHLETRTAVVVDRLLFCSVPSTHMAKSVGYLPNGYGVLLLRLPALN